MALTDQIGINTAAIFNGLDMFTQLILYAVVGLVIAAILWGSMYLLSFNILVTVRQKTNSGTVVLITKARQFKTKDGIIKWRLLKWIKEIHPPPPTNYLELTTKGKFIASCDRTIDGTFTWRQISESPKVQDAFTSEEKTIAAIEFRRAEEYKKVKTLDKVLALAPMLMVIMILVIVFAFWGDIAKKSTDALNAIQPNMEQITQSNIRLANALENYYRIQGYEVIQNYTGSVPPPDINPNDNKVPN